MEPLGQSRSEQDLPDLCDKMGKLYGEKGFIDQVNQSLSIKEQYRLPWTASRRRQIRRLGPLQAQHRPDEVLRRGRSSPAR
jgi:hypothetical protein